MFVLIVGAGRVGSTVARSALTAVPYLIFAALFLSAQNPPLDAARLDIVVPGLWGRAEAVRTMVRTGAQALAPLLFGVVSDYIFGGGRTGLQWAFFVANDVEPNMIAVMQHRVMFPPEKRNAALADDADAKLQPKLRVLDEHLAKNRYFGGDKWDMADFMVASVCYSFTAMKYNLSKYPSFQKWLMASIERPKAKEARALRE